VPAVKILMVGVSTRAFAASAASAGHRVVSVDYFADCDQALNVQALSLGRDFGLPLSTDGLVEAARKMLPGRESRQGFDGVVFCAGVENRPAMAGLVGSGKRLGNAPQAIRSGRDLKQVQAVLGSLGSPCGVALPETIFPGESLPSCLEDPRPHEKEAAHPGRGWLLKDLRRSGGMGVQVWDGARPIGWGQKRRSGARQVLQRVVPGTLASAVFLADGEHARVVGMSLQLAGLARLGARRFAWCGNLAPLVRPELQSRIESAAQALTRAFGLVGINGMDFIVRCGTPYLLEVNPRPCGSVELFERLYGWNAFDLHLCACRRDMPAPGSAGNPGLCWGKGILYARRDLTTPDTHGWPGRGVCDVPHPGEAIPCGSPVCSVLASAGSLAGCWRAIRTEVDRLELELYAAVSNDPPDPLPQGL